MYTVDLQDCIDKMDLECLTPDVDISKIKITQSDINRPALRWQDFLIILTTIVYRLSVMWKIRIWKNRDLSTVWK